ncbi:DUF6600 domain-containing protein, partial [Marinobacterium sedimentorum]|uniref:DUF6600 domain-containing protein n=1 Tax=Marinobacterium sedimentorum TaxID=2927804 RepID=UPI0034CF5085|nr:hypothetical protein [Marinobacterium sedimentorum]
MSTSSRLVALPGLLLFALYAVLFASSANADPSGRVGYLSDSHGLVSYSPSGEDQWVNVVRNRPLIRGDRLWTDRDARAEFQVGSAAVRIDSNSSVEILDLDDRITQLQLTQGALGLNVRRLYRDQLVEIDTPLLAFTINGSGRYRIDVDPRYGTTTIVVWDGTGEVYGDNTHFSLRAGDTVRFYDEDLHDYRMYGLPREDNFDRYGLERDQRYQRAESLRYVDDDLVGYGDLDEYGSWSPVSGHGHVWFPSNISVNWAPFRDGHWAWQEPWGWTWVDNAPWGFAPSHYGRWISVKNRWGWVPGPRRTRPVYAPALVAFIGGSGWSLSLSLGGDASPIGWFPLGPREVYVPSYQVSRDYFTRINVNNTVVQNTTITNIYNNYYSSNRVDIDQVNYANRQMEQAVTVVPSSVFVNAQPVRSAAMRVDRKALSSGKTQRIAQIAPRSRSVIGSGELTKAHPAAEVFDRRVVARNAPPPAEAPFAQREQLLQKKPGRALEPAAAKTEQGHTTKRPKNVRVIGTQENAVDIRASESRNAGDSAQQQPLDRSVEPKRKPEPGKPGNDKQAVQQTQEQQAGKADSDSQAAQQQQDQKQQKQEQQQRKADNDRKAAQQQQEQDRQQRKADSDRQPAQQQEQQQRKADNDRKAAQQQQEQEQLQRKADSDQKAAQQHEQQQRKADNDRKAAQQQQEQEQLKRKADNDRQAAQQQEQQQRKADNDRKAAQQQQEQEQLQRKA